MLDPITIIKTAGLIGVFLVIFSESGLFFGFFLPGDTLLFASGLFASRGYFPLSILILGCGLAAILGYHFSYWTGKKIGRKLFERKASFFFNKKGIDAAENFYTKYGPLTIIAARFIPFIRTFAPVIAGVAEMKYRTFFIFNLIGGVLWATFVPTVGYYFGGLIPNPDRYIFPIVIFIISISFLPIILKLIYNLLFKRS